MGDGGDAKGLTGPLPGLAVVAALVAAWMWWPQPLRSDRPEVPRTGVRRATTGENVEARLWQDPFAAVWRSREVRPDETVGSSLEELARQLRLRLPEGRGFAAAREGGPAVTVLVMLVDGGPYAELLEERRRQRYAMVAALGVESITPERAEHVGFLELGPGERGGGDGRAADPALLVPFEWYRRGAPITRVAPPEAGPDHVLALWVDETGPWRGRDGGADPLASVDRIVGGLVTPEDLELGRVGVVVVGPGSSTTLLSMLEAGSADGARRWAHLISTRATAPLDLLLRQAGVEVQPPASGTDAAGPATVRRVLGVKRFTPTLADDRVVTRALIDELERRGVPLRLKATKIALVGEWDTPYARTLGDLFQLDLDRRRVETGWREAAEVESFRYLRGVDGQLPGEPKSQPGGAAVDSPEEGAGLSDRERVDLMERPEGRSQLDAIRRLARRLRVRSVELRGLGCELAAVGVVGSDVYDKQLILQALRSVLTDAVFFTTDLDARLVHPRQYPWTRNLVIGSAWGLDLAREWQQWVPPFRNSYSVSTFLACRLAVEPPVRAAGPGALGPRIETAVAAPRVFEVARTGAWDLSVEPGSRAEGALHPDPAEGRPSPVACAGWTLAVLLVLVLAVTSPRLMRRASPHGWAPDEQEQRQLRTVRLASILLAVALTVAMCVASADPAGEPFALASGISVWVTELARFLVALVAVTGLVHAAGNLRQSRRQIAARFGLPGDPSSAPASLARPLRRQPGPWLRWLRAVLTLDWRPDLSASSAYRINDPVGAVSAREVWAGYLALGRPSSRWTRILVALVAFFVLGGALMSLLGQPTVPARGLVARRVDTLVLVASVVGTWLLTLYTLDVTRLCERLVQWFSVCATRWPTAARERADEETGLAGLEAGEYLELRVLAEHTDVVSRLVVPPFVAVFLLIVSRSGLVDGWTWPVALVLVFALLLGLALASAVLLRLSAERARRATLRTLGQRRIALIGSGESGHQARLAQLETVIEEIRGLREGAFAPWSHHPVVRAAILPFGGAGALWVLDLFAKLGI